MAAKLLMKRYAIKDVRYTWSFQPGYMVYCHVRFQHGWNSLMKTWTAGWVTRSLSTPFFPLSNLLKQKRNKLIELWEIKLIKLTPQSSPPTSDLPRHSSLALVLPSAVKIVFISVLARNLLPLSLTDSVLPRGLGLKSGECEGRRRT